MPFLLFNPIPLVILCQMLTKYWTISEFWHYFSYQFVLKEYIDAHCLQKHMLSTEDSKMHSCTDASLRWSTVDTLISITKSTVINYYFHNKKLKFKLNLKHKKSPSVGEGSKTKKSLIVYVYPCIYTFCQLPPELTLRPCHLGQTNLWKFYTKIVHTHSWNTMNIYMYEYKTLLPAKKVSIHQIKVNENE